MILVELRFRKEFKSTRPSFSFSFSQMLTTDVYIFPAQSWNYHQSKEIILRLRERDSAHQVSIFTAEFLFNQGRAQGENWILWSYRHDQYFAPPSCAWNLWPGTLIIWSHSIFKCSRIISKTTVTKTWDIMQKEFKCCGVDNSNEWFHVAGFGHGKINN